MKRYARPAALALLLIGLAFGQPKLATAEFMSSTHYRIPFDALSGGGDRSTSTNYIFEDTLSEVASPTGEGLSSTNYLACVGYQCLDESPFITVTYAVQSAACDSTSSSSPPYTVGLGTLTTSAVTTASNRVCVRVTANASGGVVVQGRSTNGSLKSVSVPGDTIPSSTATLAAAASGYGVCSSNAQNGFAAVAPFDGTCNTVAGHAVGGVTTSNRTIWSINGPVTNGYGELLTKASVSTSVAAHNDYQDVLTITVTGTF